MSRDAGDRIGEAYTLLRLSVIDLQEASYEQAVVRLQQALALFRTIRHRAGEAQTPSSPGEVGLRQGRYRQATDYYRQALVLFRNMGDLADEAEALNGLGEVMPADGDPAEARTFFGTALDLARRAGVPYDQACAHNGLGHAFHAAGDHRQARHHWQHALELFGELGAPEAEQVRGQLGEPIEIDKAAGSDDRQPGVLHADTTIMTVRPILILSPFFSRCVVWIGSPLSEVPLVEPRSSTYQRPRTTRKRAW